MFKNLVKFDFAGLFHEILSDAYTFFAGLLGSLVGYLMPIKETAHVLIFFFILDVIFGYCNARKNRGEKFRARIIWEKTIPKILVSFLIILTAHMLDQLAPLEVLTIREFVGWFLCGVILSNVWKNFYNITKWSIIDKIRKSLDKKIDNETKK